MMPARLLPAVTARMTTAACRLNPRPWMIGCRMLPSICCTSRTMPSTISAVVNPLLTRAMRTANAPATTAPMIGMNPPKNVSTASGMTSGHAEDPQPQADEERVDEADQGLLADELRQGRPGLVGQRGHVAGHPRAGLRRQPRHPARAVLQEEEDQHQREHQVQQAVADDRGAGERVPRDVLRVVLDRVDDRVDGVADLVLAEVERRALQPLLDVLQGRWWRRRQSSVTWSATDGAIAAMMPTKIATAASRTVDAASAGGHRCLRRNRVAGHSTVAISRPSTTGSRIDHSLPEHPEQQVRRRRRSAGAAPRRSPGVRTRAAASARGPPWAPARGRSPPGSTCRAGGGAGDAPVLGRDGFRRAVGTAGESEPHDDDLSTEPPDRPETIFRRRVARCRWSVVPSRHAEDRHRRPRRPRGPAGVPAPAAPGGAAHPAARRAASSSRRSPAASTREGRIVVVHVSAAGEGGQRPSRPGRLAVRALRRLRRPVGAGRRRGGGARPARRRSSRSSTTTARSAGSTPTGTSTARR